MRSLTTGKRKDRKETTFKNKDRIYVTFVDGIGEVGENLRSILPGRSDPGDLCRAMDADIIRNLLSGCRTFSDLLDGASGINKALLAQRLEVLERSGILTKEPNGSRRGHHYVLTEKGRGLSAVTDAMGSWGARWLELESRDIDALTYCGPPASL